jgi:hypothetical protein
MAETANVDRNTIDRHDAEATCFLALERAQVITWLLDKLAFGELDLRGGRPGSYNFDPDQLGELLERWAVASLEDARRDIRQGLKVIYPAVVGNS